MSSTKNPQSGGIFDRLSKSDTYASSKMKSAGKPVKSKKDPQDPSPKGKTTSSFFDRMSKTETYATAQTRKVNRKGNDGTFAEASNGALKRDIKGGTYFRSKMDPKEERKRDGTGPVRKSTTAPVKNQQFFDRMSKAETVASAKTRKGNRDKDGKTFAEASDGALMRDYKGSTVMRKGMNPKAERERDGVSEEERARAALRGEKPGERLKKFQDKIVNEETTATAGNRKPARTGGKTFAETSDGILMRDYGEGSTMMRM
jgi:hypothetical protein